MWLNKSDNDLEEKNKNLISFYENLLDYIAFDLWLKLSYFVRINNINIYKTLFEIIWNIDFIEQINKKYIVDGIVKEPYIESSICKRKKEIKSWSILIIAKFFDDWKLEKIIFIKKRNIFWGFKEKIKDYTDWIISQKEPNFWWILKIKN